MPEAAIEQDAEGPADPGAETDMSVGFAVLFGLLAIAATGVMFTSEGLVRAYGFGAAFLLGALIIVALHVYE